VINITVGNHGCKIVPENRSELLAVLGYIRQHLVQSEQTFNPRTRQYEVEQKAIFASATSDKSELRILRSDLEPLLSHLDFMGYDSSRYTLQENLSTDVYETIDIEMHPNFTPRNSQQQQAVDFALVPNKITRVLQAATGFGKTFCGYWTACQLKRRTGFIMEPSHIKTWLKDAKAYCTIRDKEILVIQGSESLRAVMELKALGQLTHKFIFFSAVTLRNYITDYENKDEPFPFDVKPEDLMSYLGIGYLIRDEAHEAIHALCKQTMYFNVPKILFLSATLVSDNRFINTIYDRVYPKEDMWVSEPNKHIHVRSCFYHASSKIGLTGKGPRGYSHANYEKTILKKASLKKEYWELIRQCVTVSYIKSHKPKLKCLVIVATIKMAEYLSKMAREQWPQFTVGCYVAGAKSEELYERDIVFSTPKGAGTGVDIPNLYVGWNTVAIGSTQLQRQIMGRLREVKAYPDMSPYFFMLFNEDVPQHRAYEKKRQIDNVGRCKSYQKVPLGVTLGLK